MKRETIQAIAGILNARKDRSAWDRGVTGYALEMLENVEADNVDPENLGEMRALFLNGADDWSAYSYGGCAEIYDADIAARLCTPSELRRTHDGERRPNSRETWLDVQARALCQAYRRINSAYIRLA